MTSAVEVAEALCSHEHPLPDEILFRKEMVDLSHRACEKLDRLEQEVISGVYFEGRQLIDVAADLGYSRCHISRVKRKAIETLFNELKLDDEQRLLALDDNEGELPLQRQVARRGAQRRRLFRARLAVEESEPTAVMQVAC